MKKEIVIRCSFDPIKAFTLINILESAGYIWAGVFKHRSLSISWYERYLNIKSLSNYSIRERPWYISINKGGVLRFTSYYYIVSDKINRCGYKYIQHILDIYEK